MNDPQPPEFSDTSKLAEALSKSMTQFSSGRFQSESAGAKRRGFTLVREIGGGVPLKQPLAVAIDNEQRLLVLDRPAPDRFRLSTFSIQGELLSGGFAVSKGTANHELTGPVALAVDEEQQVFIADAPDGSVKKFAADGRGLDVFRTAGSAGALFKNPQGLALDEAGSIYVADTGNNRLVKLLPDGELGWEMERFALEPGGEADEEFFEPCSVALDPAGGVLVADRNQNRVLVFDSMRRLIRQVAEDGLLDFPSVVRMGRDGGAMYIADQGNRRVQRFDGRGARTGLVQLAEDAADNDGLSGGGDITLTGDGRIVLIDPVREVVLVLDLVKA